LHWTELAAGWDVVFNPRRALLEASTSGIEGEVRRLFGNIAAATSSNALSKPETAREQTE